MVCASSEGERARLRADATAVDEEATADADEEDAEATSDLTCIIIAECVIRRTCNVCYVNTV